MHAKTSSSSSSNYYRIWGREGNKERALASFSSSSSSFFLALEVKHLMRKYDHWKKASSLTRSFQFVCLQITWRSSSNVVAAAAAVLSPYHGYWTPVRKLSEGSKGTHMHIVDCGVCECLWRCVSKCVYIYVFFSYGVATTKYGRWSWGEGPKKVTEVNITCWCLREKTWVFERRSGQLFRIFFFRRKSLLLDARIAGSQRERLVVSSALSWRRRRQPGAPRLKRTSLDRSDSQSCTASPCRLQNSCCS